MYVGLAMIELVGAMTAQATGNASFVAATAALGLGILVFVCAIFCVWTTQDNNIYSASLSLQNIFVDTKLEGKVKHAWLAIIVAALAAIFAAVGAVKYLLPIVKALSVLLPPIPAMMIAEQWCVKNSKENQTINWVGIVSWIIATVIGQICVNRNFLIPAVVSMVVAFFYRVSARLSTSPGTRKPPARPNNFFHQKTLVIISPRKANPIPQGMGFVFFCRM